MKCSICNDSFGTLDEVVIQDKTFLLCSHCQSLIRNFIRSLCSVRVRTIVNTEKEVL